MLRLSTTSSPVVCPDCDCRVDLRRARWRVRVPLAGREWGEIVCGGCRHTFVVLVEPATTTGSAARGAA